MPFPTQSDLHINAPLTNVSVAYKQNASDYIADKVFPKVPVSKQSDLYWKYSKSDWRRTDVKRHGRLSFAAHLLLAISDLNWVFMSSTTWAAVMSPIAAFCRSSPMKVVASIWPDSALSPPSMP